MAHVGMTVPDIEAAMDWYADVLGFEPIMGPVEVEHGEEHIGKLCADVLGEFDTVSIAHMTTGNQVAVELFEFEETGPENDPDPTEAGYFHACVIDPNIEELAAEIADSGGEHHTDIWNLFPDQPYRMTYCKDPWGNIVEIYTHSHERIYSNQGDY
ncbi:glyoxalase [Natronococcus pandeyae]|uniref:Glyoxalase n=1 Tax=Natronococcus pandeyae TaxID=2055836 RepID=A0A8J8TSJ7_9EURY|nr:glyoxalase [Natronococcus pandeyae]